MKTRLDYLISTEGLWKLAKGELIKSGWRKEVHPPDSARALLEEDTPKVYIIKNCRNCGSLLYLNSFVESGKTHCNCGEPFFERDSLRGLEKVLSPFRKKEILPVTWTFGSWNQSETADA